MTKSVAERPIAASAGSGMMDWRGVSFATFTRLRGVFAALSAKQAATVRPDVCQEPLADYHRQYRATML